MDVCVDDRLVQVCPVCPPFKQLVSSSSVAQQS